MGSSNTGVERVTPSDGGEAFPYSVRRAGQSSRWNDVDNFYRSEAGRYRESRDRSDYDIDGVRRSDKWFDARDTLPAISLDDTLTAIGRGADGKLIYREFDNFSVSPRYDRSVFDAHHKAALKILEDENATPDQKQFAKEFMEYVRRRTGS